MAVASRPFAREERRVVGDDGKQSEDVRRSGTIVEGAMAKFSLSFIQIILIQILLKVLIRTLVT